jgi:signal peptidase I
MRTGDLDRPAGRRQSWGALCVSTAARVVLGVLAVLVLVSLVPVLFGWQSTVVMSGSMAPAVQPGDVALVRPVDTADLAPGDVLLVDDPSAPGDLLLHRLVAVEADGLRLQGDANAAADPALVAPTAVRGVGALRLPYLGRPALWAAEGRTAPLAVGAVAFGVLLGLALLHRPADADRDPTTPGSRPRPRRRVPAVLAAMSAALLLPGMTGTGAVFTATTESPRVAFGMARYWTCPEAVAAEAASHHYRLQEWSSSAIANTGTAGTAGNATLGGGVSFGAAGPTCGTGNDKAVSLDGYTGSIWGNQAIANPQRLTVQIWFSTRTARGGKLIGFGNATSGGLSGSYDRHIYMTDTGRLVFGVYDGTARAITSGDAYNDGQWHLATATFSSTTGMALYVDGRRVATDATVTAAENYTGYYRIGYDNLAGWPSAPTSRYFGGSLAHASVFPAVLTATEIADQFTAGD